MAPEFLAQALGKCQHPREAEKVKTQGDQYQMGQRVEEEAQRKIGGNCQPQPAKAAGNGAGKHVGEKAAGVVRQHERQSRSGGTKRECADDAAAHADAMNAAEQADQKQGEIARFDHGERHAPISLWNSGCVGGRHAGSGQTPWRWL